MEIHMENGVWPKRPDKLPAGAVRWIGTTAPTIGGGYAMAGDEWILAPRQFACFYCSSTTDYNMDRTACPMSKDGYHFWYINPGGEYDKEPNYSLHEKFWFAWDDLKQAWRDIIDALKSGG